MATRDENLATVRRIRNELTALLEGMDYCLDWKDGDNWCAREVLYHLVDTPEGGIGSVIAGVLDGTRDEITILPDANNMTPERMAADLDEAQAAPLAILRTAEDAIAAASDTDFMERTAMAHLPHRDVHEVRTVQAFIDGLERHWGEHLAQLRAIRETLGV
ncbi:MAG: DinB family protein [Chloroflexi bacterium]|nr:DinB family protein [Chloroflexota bacterium]MYD47822.1 DinB family protein [Chloroflexota bacterium]